MIIITNGEGGHQMYRNNNTESLWVFGMRIIAWVVLIGGIIAGIAITSILGNINAVLGLIVLFSSIVGSFISAAGIMIFLDMADNISHIRNTLTNTEYTPAKEPKAKLSEIDIDSDSIDPYKALSDLTGLFERGIITDEEYAKKRDALYKKI